MKLRITFAPIPVAEQVQDLALGMTARVVASEFVAGWGAITLYNLEGNWRARFRLIREIVEYLEIRTVEGSGESAMEAYHDLYFEVARLEVDRGICVGEVLARIQLLLERHENNMGR